MSETRDQQLALEIARRVRDAGGTVYYVGGCVRDKLLGHPGKDIDLEVHGVAPETLEAILDSVGERTEMGVSFGVYGLRHTELDIAMPRKETATGRGHRDFTVDVDPFLGVEKAAMRRDFTVNALMQDVLSGQIVDSFGGLEDLKKGVIRHVHDDTFAEDPLRVLRAAQFSARLGFAVAPETMALCGRMELQYLARERVMGEMEKALMKSAKPSVFFRLLREMNQLSCWFPELEALIGIAQEPKYHPEGDVWNHTMLVLDSAAMLRPQATQPLPFMLAALCHDLGKITNTRVIDGRIRAFGHETAGQLPAREMLSRLTDEVRLQKYVLNMIALHMQPNQLVAQQAGRKAFMRMLDSAVCPDDLLLLAYADFLGQQNSREAYAPYCERLQAELAAYRALQQTPGVMGSDLVRNGLKPGPYFSELLAFAHKLWLAGVGKDVALRMTLSEAKKIQAQDEKRD